MRGSRALAAVQHRIMCPPHPTTASFWCSLGVSCTAGFLQATVTLNGSQVTVAGVLDTAMLKIFHVNINRTSIQQRVQNSKMTPPCPGEEVVRDRPSPAAAWAYICCPLHWKVLAASPFYWRGLDVEPAGQVSQVAGEGVGVGPIGLSGDARRSKQAISKQATSKCCMAIWSLCFRATCSVRMPTAPGHYRASQR